MSMTIEEAIAIIEDVTWNGCGRHYGKIPVAREMAILALEEVQKYRAIGTVEEFRQLKEINEKITEVVNKQLVAGRNSYKETHECFHKIADIVQGRNDWSEGKE